VTYENNYITDDVNFDVNN